MKVNRIKVAFVLWTVVFLSATAYAQSNAVEQVRESLKAGSAKELSKHLFQTVDVTIDGRVQSYSKAQAEFVFRDFFRQHPPSDFRIIHQGSSKGGQPFAIGQYKSGEETYRVFMKLRIVNKQQLLHEISFSRE